MQRRAETLNLVFFVLDVTLAGSAFVSLWHTDAEPGLRAASLSSAATSSSTSQFCVDYVSTDDYVVA